MDVVIIERTAFEEILKKVAELKRTIEAKNKPDSNWLDSKDVCDLLKISTRTLHFYRTSGKIPFTRLEGKIFYRETDIVRVINNGFVKANKDG